MSACLQSLGNPCTRSRNLPKEREMVSLRVGEVWPFQNQESEDNEDRARPTGAEMDRTDTLYLQPYAAGGKESHTAGRAWKGWPMVKLPRHDCLWGLGHCLAGGPFALIM